MRKKSLQLLGLLLLNYLGFVKFSSFCLLQLADLALLTSEVIDLALLFSEIGLILLNLLLKEPRLRSGGAHFPVIVFVSKPFL